ncbi:MAG: hypothetical protein CVU81_00955 [Euryarchaeota archaeon HGW-Euryarchaeota-1]|nr:MAG: hypothetical protein CVU81_00955 [Euryarchaeota archaeon HGW-Euryarchaeota-1]
MSSLQETHRARSQNTKDKQKAIKTRTRRKIAPRSFKRLHAVKTQKTSKKRSKLGHAERLHQDRFKGYHGFPVKVTGKIYKVNKKHTLLLTCPECKKSLLKNYPRLKTLEIAKE